MLCAYVAGGVAGVQYGVAGCLALPLFQRQSLQARELEGSRQVRHTDTQTLMQHPNHTTWKEVSNILR